MSTTDNKKYTAFTIGPIYDTLSLASTPGALWMASYIFSHLTKCICEVLVEKGIPEKNIIVPYFLSKTSKDEHGKNILYDSNNGVGLLHDRIIVSHDGLTDDKKDDTIDPKKKKISAEFIKDVKEKALERLFEDFEVIKDKTSKLDEEGKEFLKEYILIADATFEASNAILDSGRILDAIELNKSYVYNSTKNPLLTVFEGQTDDSNIAIKELKLVNEFRGWQLVKRYNKENSTYILKSLLDISAHGLPKEAIELKKHNYYAIVRSDGDNMSKIIKDLNNDEEVRTYSKKCLEYCSEIANLVKSFGGVTIYSGGDDLLAILPCEDAQGKTIFEFIDKANDTFKNSFDKNEQVSLSFGISICHHKFPLYEALEESADLLFGVAKGDDHDKNCAAIKLHKHSGQSAGLVIKNNSLTEFLSLQDTALKKSTSKTPDEQVLLSVLHKLATFRHFFDGTKDEAMIRNLFKNTFDAEAHVGQFIETDLPEFFIKLIKGDIYIKALNDNKDYPNKTKKETPYTDTLCSVLRILKFFTEKAGEKQ